MLINRRKLLIALGAGLLGGAAVRLSDAYAQSAPTVPERPNRDEPLDLAHVTPLYGFKTPTGLLIVFEAPWPTPGWDQFGDMCPYFFPGQMEVGKTETGFRIPYDGFAGGSSDYRATFSQGSDEPRFKME